MEVRYEDLLQSPREEFGRIFDFLEAASDDKTVSRCVRRTGFKKASGGRERGEEDPCSGVRKGVAGDWKNVFTDRDAEIFREETGDLLVKFGYDADGGE